MDRTVLIIVLLLSSLLLISLRSFLGWRRKYEVKGVRDLGKLEDLEVRFNSLLHGINEACFFVRTSDFSILEFNKRAYQLIGFTREELSKTTLYDVLSENSTGDLSVAMQKVLESDTDASLAFELERSDEVTIPVDISVKPTRWKGESALLVVMSDTLEKMRLKEKVAEEQGVLSALSLIVNLFTDPSEETERLLDLSRIVRQLIPHHRMALHTLTADGSELLGAYVDSRHDSRPVQSRVNLLDGSPHGRTIEMKRPVLITDMSRDTGGKEGETGAPGRGSFCSALITPLFVENRVIGTAELFDMRPRAYTQKELEVMKLIAKHIALGLHTSSLSKEMERKTQRLRQILVTSNSFRLQVFLDDLLREIVWSVRFSTDIDSVALGMVESDGENVTIKALASEDKEVVRKLIGRSLSWESFSNLMDEKNRVGRSYLIYNDEPLLSASRSPDDDLVVGDTEKRLPPKNHAALFVPIESRVGKIVGFLLVEDPKEGVRPSLETIQTLEIFANQVAVVIENQRLFAEARQKTRELEILNEKLRASKEDIEAFAKKLEESNRELEKVNAELVEADRFKAEFLQNITHELKTPIAPIIINSDMLLSRRLGELEERQEEVLQSINQSGKRLNELIMDLLYLSRMEDGKLEFVMEAIDAGMLIGSSLREVTPLAREKGITLDERVEEEIPSIRGDERHLIQLLTNLLRNAVKFTAEGGTVRCSARQADSNGSRVELEVSDTGIGIPETRLHKIFDRFYQVDGSATRKYQGAGLGLAIVKKIVEAHDGEIDIASKVGEGSTFRVRLPAYNGDEERRGLREEAER